MPIEIIQDDEKRTFHYEDAKIHYRRVPISQKKSLIKKHTKIVKGSEQLDALGFMRDVFQKCTMGWENITSGGNPIDYSIDSLMRLPESVLILYMEHMDKLDHEIQEEMESQEKN